MSGRIISKENADQQLAFVSLSVKGTRRNEVNHMGELYKTQHTIDEMLDRMGVKIVLDSEHLSEEDRFEAEKQGASVVLKKVSDKEKAKE